MPTEFVHLHVHTENSMLDGLGTVNDYVERAKALGMPALAITDHGNLCGVPAFYQAARKLDVEPLVGCEMYYVPDATWRPPKGSKERSDPNHVTVLARGYRGYQVLAELSTETHRQFYGKPLLDNRLIEALSDRERASLVVLSGCAGGTVARPLLEERRRDAVATMMWWREMFPHYFLEIMDHGTDFDVPLNRALIALSQRYGVPLVATNDPHYVVKADAEHHDCLLAIQTGADIDAPDRFRFDGSGYHLRSTREMSRALRGYGREVWEQALRNTNVIARNCHTRIPDWETRTWHIPKFPDCDNAQAEMERLTRRGLRARGRLTDREYVRRAKHELGVFVQVGIADFMLITMDIVQEAKRRGIPVGPGRGSVCGTLVGYAIGIHAIDSIRYGLLFERFLNPERPSMPDVDMDFGKARRHEMFQYVEDKYGAENVVHVAAFQSLKIRRSFHAIAGAHGVEFAERMRIAKMFGKDTEDDDVEDVLPEELVKRFPDMAAQIVRFNGIKAGISQHPAGVIIADPKDQIKKLVPQMWIASSKKMVAQFDLKASDATGLLKEDLLALRALDTIQTCCDIVEQQTGERPDPDSWVPDEEERDDEVWAMIAEGDTAGVFQMEGPCFPEETPVLTPDGWKPIGQLEPGDRVADPRGEDSKVVAVHHKGEEWVYRLNFSDGSTLEATDDHLWPLIKVGRTRKPCTMRTRDIAKVLEAGGLVVMEPVQPMDLESEGPRPLKPYLLGALLGDGSFRITNGYQIRFTTTDEELLQHVREACPAGSDFYAESGIDYRCIGEDNYNPVQRGVRELGLSMVASAHKFVPRQYLWDTVDRRLELLRGLMDTDGTIDGAGRMGFCSTGHQLAEDVLFLVRSLGGKASLALKRRTAPTTYPSGRQSWAKDLWVVRNIRFANQSINPFKLSRKANKVRVRGWLRGWGVKSIERTRRCNVACIEVSAESRLYVADQFIATHNTNMRGAKAVKPKEFEDVVSVTSLYRTGPINAGFPQMFLDNRQMGRKRIRYAHSKLKPILEPTWGVILYQEQVMEIGKELAGFNMVQVDDIKNAIKYKKSSAMDTLKPVFVEGCRKVSGMGKDAIDLLWKQIEGYAGYCLTGDTVVVRAASNHHEPDPEITLEELWRRWNSKTPVGKKYRRQGITLLAYKDGAIRPVRCSAAHQNGVKPVWTIKMDNGMSITSTANHRHRTPRGWKRTDKLAPGDRLLVNAGKSLQPMPSSERDRYIGPLDDLALAEHAATLPPYCEFCWTSEGRLEIAHLDQDRTNNHRSNLRRLCNTCHKMWDQPRRGTSPRFRKGYNVAEATIQSIEYAGEEMTYCVTMEDEEANFVANGIITHNSYNRSHAVAYTMISYQTARLRLLYPLAYITALLRTVDRNKQNIEKRAWYLRGALERGIKVLPPDINVSDADAGPDWRAGAIRFGLTDIKGVGDKAAEKVVANRPRRGYRSVEEVEKAVRNVGTMKALTAASVLESLGVEGDQAATEELLSWTFEDTMTRYRRKYGNVVRLPSPDRDSVKVVGEIVRVTKAETKNGKPYMNWRIRWSLTESWHVRLWSETSRLWDIPEGSVVMVHGEWSEKWGNISVNDSDDVKLIRRKRHFAAVA